MFKKRIYFVRHGQSEANVESMVQGEGIQDPLTQRGKEQALLIAERASHIEFETLISSDLPRAAETADAISGTTGREVVPSELFREVRWPSSTLGKRYEDEEVINYHEAVHAHVHEPGWRYEDEENFDDLTTRAHRAIDLLEGHESESILVVTHGQFLRFVVSVMLMDKTLTPENWFYLKDAMKTKNTGVTVCTLSEMRWQLLTWNDYAHFAE